MNSITIVGNLTADPRAVSEERTLFTVAVNRMGKKGETDFIPCVAWNGTAKFVNTYFHKGSSIGVTGSLQSYKNKEGLTSYIVQVRTAEFVGKKGDNGDGASRQAPAPAPAHAPAPAPAQAPKPQPAQADNSFDSFSIEAEDFDFPF